MNDQINDDTDPLLHPLGPAQQALLEIVGAATTETGTWPVYQYVEAKLDDLGFDTSQVFASLPAISHLHMTYSLARRDGGGREEEPVKLTIAGIAHLTEFGS